MFVSHRPSSYRARLATIIGVALIFVITVALSGIQGPVTRSFASAPIAQNLRSGTTSIRIYLVVVGDNGRSGPKIGCGDSLVAVARPIAATAQPLRAALTSLLSDHRRYYGQSGLYNALYQSRLRVQGASVLKGVATVHLAGTLQLGGECDNPRVGAQLRKTVLQFRSVTRPAIFVNGTPLWKRLSLK